MHYDAACPIRQSHTAWCKGAGKGAAGYGVQLLAVIFYWAWDGDGWYRAGPWVELFERVVSWLEFDVRVEAVDNDDVDWDFYGILFKLNGNWL